MPTDRTRRGSIRRDGAFSTVRVGPKLDRKHFNEIWQRAAQQIQTQADTRPERHNDE